MASKIEIYVRPSGDRVLLNIMIDKGVREQFIQALSEGHFSDRSVGVAVELSVLPEWRTEIGEDHIRVPITEVNVIDLTD